MVDKDAGSNATNENYLFKTGDAKERTFPPGLSLPNPVFCKYQCEFRLLTVCYAAPSNKSNIRLPQFGMISPSTANTCSYESTPISETQFGTPKNISHPAFTNSNLANSLFLIIA